MRLLVLILKLENVTSPCQRSEELKDEFIKSWCSESENYDADHVSDTPTLSDFYDFLDGVDKIIEDPSFTNCKNLKCIYDLLNDNRIGSFCDNILKFDNSSHIDLNISVKKIFIDGKVSMSSNESGVNMVFDSDFCSENDYLKIAELILHESYHAKFRYDLANNNMSESQYKNEFSKWAKEKYGLNGLYTEHQVIIKEYMKIIAKELMKFDGNRYTYDYYMAYVWDGLSGNWPGLFTENEILSWNTKRSLITLNHINCN